MRCVSITKGRTILLFLFCVAITFNILSIQIFERSIQKSPPTESSIRIHQEVPWKDTPTQIQATTITVPLRLGTKNDGPSTKEKKRPQQQQQKEEPSQERKSIPQDVCRPNVIVYLAQKGNHTSYGRDSFGLLTKSMDLLYQNYLNDYYETATLLIFHTGDFTEEDVTILEQRQSPHTHGTLQLVDLTRVAGGIYWSLPQFLQQDNQSTWFLPDYSVGYRHMMRWYALKLYEYLRDTHPCRYKYVMRMDEESYIYSPIRYDVFSFMKTHGYSYGFRLCSFEMKHMKSLWQEYKKQFLVKTQQPLKMERPSFLQDDLCGFYNNWFILELDWIFEPPVQDWLQWIDGTGYIYRKRVNDLIIHSAAVYAFLAAPKIHRFLDFTYQHFTNYKESGCPLWGAIAGGYADPNALETIMDYHERDIVQLHCPRPEEKVPYYPRLMTNLSVGDQSPTYHHLTDKDMTLPVVAAGFVDLQDIGLRSG